MSSPVGSRRSACISSSRSRHKRTHVFSTGGTMLVRITIASLILVAPLAAQAPAAAANARPTILPADQQIAAAVLPIPAEFRPTAQVLEIGRASCRERV